MKRPELLMPAAELNTLYTAIRFGADAVYIGGEAFSLRARADNFTMDDMAKAVAFANDHNAKVYVAANILAHDTDIEEIRTYFKELSGIRPHGVIISDPGVFMMAKELMPDTELHISTQANNTNHETFNFWYAMGAKRVVAARELSLSEISGIRSKIPADMEIEVFVHGAMCISYSGRCLLSSFLTGRDANKGECTHPCRWKYDLVEETRPGEYFPVEENERGTFILNSRDLRMVDHIDDLIDAGIDSFKVEGRMKSELYVATVANAYRMAIDDYLADPMLYKENIPYYLEELNKCTHRKYYTGFFYGRPGEEALIYENSTYEKDYVFLGRVEDVTDKKALIHQKNKFYAGDDIEILRPGKRFSDASVLSMEDKDHKQLESCPHPGQEIYLTLDNDAAAGDILRKKGNA